MTKQNYKGYKPQFHDKNSLRIAELVMYAAHELSNSANPLEERLSSIELQKRGLLETAQYLSSISGYRRFFKEEKSTHSTGVDITQYKVNIALSDIGKIVELYAKQLLDKKLKAKK